MKKEFILGLEECLTAENITLSFDGDNDVTIPMAVLELLFAYKGEEEKKVLASKLVDYIKSFPYDRLSTNGCKQKNGSILRVCENGSISGFLKEKANISNITRRIFQLCFDRAKAAKCKSGYPNRMPVGSGNQLAKWNGWNYFHRKEPCDNGSE